MATKMFKLGILFFFSIIQFSISEKYNVLFVIFDDLRTDLSTYREDNVVHTPNFDKFASESVQFQRAYTNIPLCGPSRASFLTGRSPQTLKYYYHKLQDVNDDAVVSRSKSVPISAVFKRNGYRTIGGGKIFHSKKDTNKYFQKSLHKPNNLNDPDCPNEVVCDSTGGDCRSHRRVYCEAENDAQFTDNKLTDWYLKEIDQLSRSKKPWFLTLGLHRPHMPWRFPKHIAKHYEDLPVTSSMAANNVRSNNWFAHGVCRSMNEYLEVFRAGDSTQIGSPPFKSSTAQLLRKGYWSSVTYVDELLGEIYERLEKRNLVEKTIIVLSSDHGWQLGEHGNWCKNTNYELSSRVPLFIRHPEGRRGVKEDTIVSLLDLYPTLVSLAGISLNKKEQKQVEGKDFSSLLQTNDTEFEGSQRYAFTTVAKCADIESGTLRECAGTKSSLMTLVGYSVRTENFRYTEYRKFNGKGGFAEWGGEGLIGTELYDYRTEISYTNPDLSENNNIIESVGVSSERSELSQLIKKQFVACEGRKGRNSCEKSTVYGQYCRWHRRKCVVEDYVKEFRCPGILAREFEELRLHSSAICPLCDSMLIVIVLVNVAFLTVWRN